MPKKSKLLNKLGESLSNIDKNINVEEIPIVFLKELTDSIAYNVTEYRADISYHPLENIIMVTFVGLLANCNEWPEIYEFSIIHIEWFKKFLNLEYGIPSKSTFMKTMAIVDPNELENFLFF